MTVDEGSVAARRLSWGRFALRDLTASLRSLIDADSDRSRTGRDALFAFLVRCVSAALLYASQVALARWMGSAEYGIYITLWTCVLLIGGLSHLGMNLGIIRLVATRRAAADLPRLRGLVDGARLLALVNGALAALLCALALWLFGAPARFGGAANAALMVCAIPFFALSDVQDGIGRGNGWIGTALVPPYVLRPLLLLVFMALAWSAAAPMVAHTAAVCAVAAAAVAALLQAAAVSRQARASLGPGPRIFEPRAWLASSLPLLAISGCEILLQNTDVLVLAQATSPASVAVYFAAGKTMSLIMFIHYAVGSAFASRFASLKALGDEAGLHAAVREAVRWTFWPSLAAAILILALGRPLLQLFGPGFVAGYPVMAILVFGFLARSAMGPSEFLLNMLGEQRRSAAVLIFAAVLDILLNLTLVPLYGTTGAALSTATALVSAALLNAYTARRHLGLRVAIWHHL